MELTRRRTLAATGAAIGLAGCVDDLPGDGGGSGGDGDGNGTGNGNGSDDVAYDVFQLGTQLGQPLWATVDDVPGFVTLLESGDDRPWMVEDTSEVDGLEAWLDETDFDRSTVVYVESEGPNTCYDEIEVRDVSVEDDAILGTAAAVDTSGEDEACGQAFVYPSAFVRVTGDDLPSAATFTVTDGQGTTGDVTTDGLLVDPAALPGHVSPGGDPGKLEELSCDEEGFRRHWSPDGEVALGEAHDDGDVTFAMRVHGTQALAADDGGPRVGRGDEVRVTMHNVSTAVQYTGNRHKWNLEVLTMDGWQDVRGTTDGEPVGYTDEAIAHRPGEGFEWSFEMTEESIVAGHPHEERLVVCPDLQPGRYRFVHREAGGGPLAVEFQYEG